MPFVLIDAKIVIIFNQIFLNKNFYINFYANQQNDQPINNKKYERI